MTLQFKTREVYGSLLRYPVNDVAEAICKLTGRKTLTADDLRIARDELGMTLKQVFDSEVIK